MNSIDLKHDMYSKINVVFAPFGNPPLLIEPKIVAVYTPASYGIHQLIVMISEVKVINVVHWVPSAVTVNVYKMSDCKQESAIKSNKAIF